jgi:acetyl-CoA synthetase (ADP-forming)
MEPEAKEVCVAYGIPTPKFRVARSAEEAISLGEEFTYPVVLKIVSPDILHKTEAGGVIAGLNSKEQVLDAYNRIISNVKQHDPRARVEGILVQSMAPVGVEVIVGGLRDSTFGPTVLFGMGGIFVEVLKDASFRVAPITELDSRQMIEEIRGYALLRGIRGQPPSDEGAITQILQATSKIMLDNPQIQQIDLNPVIVYARGATAVDARIILE